MTKPPSLALSLILLLAACGQSGALYLPEKEKEKAPVPQAPPPAVAHPPADAAHSPVPEAPPPAVAKPKNNTDTP